VSASSPSSSQKGSRASTKPRARHPPATRVGQRLGSSTHIPRRAKVASFSARNAAGSGARSGLFEFKTDVVYAVRRDANGAGVRLRQLQDQEHRAGYAKGTERRHVDGREARGSGRQRRPQPRYPIQDNADFGLAIEAKDQTAACAFTPALSPRRKR
jgi:hypothetical protein